MPGQRRAQAAAPAETVADLHALARSRASAWFPELIPDRTEVEVAPMSARPRSSLSLVTFRQGESVRRVVVKVRRDPPPGETPGPESRPTFVPDRVSAADQSRLEYDGMRTIEAMLPGPDDRFAPVRALEHLPEWNGLVLEHVGAATGRGAVLAASRVAIGSAGRRRLGARAPDLFRNAGAWLRCFHAAPRSSGQRARSDTTAELSALVGGYAGYLGSRVGAAAGAFAEQAGAVALEALPARLPTGLGHGDFALRNTFVEPSGRVLVIDPMPRWQAPVYEDIGRWLVSVRLLGMQVQTQGAALSGRWLAEREREFLTGYFGPGSVPAPQVHSFQLLVLLDKWSALASQRPVAPSPVARARAAWEDHYVGREGRRLLSVVRTYG